MSARSSSNGNVKQVVPFLRVSDMERSVRFYGSERSCEALSVWGEETRRVIAPALGWLYGVEEELEACLGVPRRKRVERALRESER